MGDGEEHPVAYYSRKLLPHEEKYWTIASTWQSSWTFRVYLLGRPFTIQTEHRSLEWLDRLKENNSRLTHWSLALQPYQYSVQYRTGQKNGNADALSQYMVEVTSVSQEKVEGVSGKPVTAGTQRSSDELHVDESRQGDNERLNDCLHSM